MSEKFADLKAWPADPANRQHYVADLFDNLAPRYDRFNRWVSFNRDEQWRKAAISRLGEQRKGIVLDLAAGTGDLSNNALRAGAERVHAFDISYEMLRHARTKLWPGNTKQISAALEQGSAHCMPYKNESFNGIVSGFAMRNVFHFLDAVLEEMYRVLKPGGRFAILELSRPDQAWLRFGFRLHMRTVMPLIGRLTTGKAEPFHYLYKTTMTFLSPVEFQDRLEKAGFANVGYQTFLLGGIAIHYGSKQ